MGKMCAKKNNPIRGGGHNNVTYLFTIRKEKEEEEGRKYCMWVIFLPDIMVLPSNALSSRPPETNWALW